MRETADDNAEQTPQVGSLGHISTAHFHNGPLFCSLVSVIKFLLEKNGHLWKAYYATCCQLFASSTDTLLLIFFSELRSS